jgi:hypothetical protein
MAMKFKLINESGEKTFALVFEKGDEVIGAQAIRYRTTIAREPFHCDWSADRRSRGVLRSCEERLQANRHAGADGGAFIGGAMSRSKVMFPKFMLTSSLERPTARLMAGTSWKRMSFPHWN